MFLFNNIEDIREYLTSQKFGEVVGSYKRKWVWALWLKYVNNSPDEVVRDTYYRIKGFKPATQLVLIEEVK